MSNHITKVEAFDNGVKASCTCGWIDRWPVADGSAQQSAAAHEAKHNNRILDLSTPENKANAREALPALLVGGMLGNEKASRAAGEVIGDIFAEALKPSIEALERLTRKDS